MHLTSFTNHGLLMLMRMASAPDSAFSTADLTDEFGLSRKHLAKIMQRLAQAGLVGTRRAGGGARMLGGRCRLKARMEAAEAAYPDLVRAMLADIALEPMPA